MSLEKNRLKTVLVTGGSGFLGTHLCRRMVSEGYGVTSLDLRAPSTPGKGVHTVMGDVRDGRLLQTLVDAADVIYHLAATVSIPACQEAPVESYSNNLGSTLGVLEAIRIKAQRNGAAATPMVFASTAAIYGTLGDNGHALSEMEQPHRFLSYYAAQKDASENAIELHSRFFDIPVTVFRFFNIVGPGQDPSSPYSGVITLFTDLAKRGKPLPLNGGGTQTRDFISVHDIIDACIAVLDLPRDRWSPQPINLGTGKATTVREVAELLAKAHAGKSPLVAAPAREGDVLHSRADASRARDILNWQAKRSIQDCLSEL